MTFIEDSLRILTQWSDQLLYLRDFRKSKIMPLLPDPDPRDLGVHGPTLPLYHCLTRFLCARFSSLGNHAHFPYR